VVVDDTLREADQNRRKVVSHGRYVADGPWRPHVMPFIAYDRLATWGATFKGSPIFAPPPSAGFHPYQPVTIAIPVSHWSDGSPAPK
jgi:hypothetical protein